MQQEHAFLISSLVVLLSYVLPAFSLFDMTRLRVLVTASGMYVGISNDLPFITWKPFEEAIPLTSGSQSVLPKEVSSPPTIERIFRSLGMRISNIWKPGTFDLLAKWTMARTVVSTTRSKIACSFAVISILPSMSSDKTSMPIFKHKYGF